MQVVGMERTTKDPTQGVYGISVAAELVGTGVQNLRAYEKRGLLEPSRTEGGTRLYSENDLARLVRIGELLEGGLNLAGVAMVLEPQSVACQQLMARVMAQHGRHEEARQYEAAAQRLSSRTVTQEPTSGTAAATPITFQ